MRPAASLAVLAESQPGFLKSKPCRPAAGCKSLKLRVGEGVNGSPAPGSPHAWNDVSADARYAGAASPGDWPSHWTSGGEVRGVLNVDSDRTGAFSEADQDLPQELRAWPQVIRNTGCSSTA